MSDADQNESGQGSGGGATASVAEALPVSRFEVVPIAESNLKELYSFREAMAPEPVQAAPKQQAPPLPIVKILLMLVLLAGGVLVAFTVPSLFQSKPPVPYIDLGSQRFDPAGLSGRLIARWDNGSSYQLFIDPIDPHQAEAFAAVAQDPPRQLSIMLRFRDDAGIVACQKRVLLPEPGAETAAPRQPQVTDSGDTMQNMTGENGQIAEIDLSGPLPCTAKAYSSFKTWDFITDFPTAGEEDIWLKQESEQNGKSHAGNALLSPRTRRLAVGIEGDDEIVGDNPSHGTVETSSGRVFFLGAEGMHTRITAWPVFPAPIHFHCDKNGSCVLTRDNSSVSLRARLVH